MDDLKKRRFTDWLKGLKTDIYLHETAAVMQEMISMEATAKK